MRKRITYLFYNIKDRIFKQYIQNVKKCKVLDYGGISHQYSCKKYGGKQFLSGESLQETITSMINRGKPFMIARFGTVELNFIKAFDFQMKKIYKDSLHILQMNAGFFPCNESYGHQFVSLMKDSMKECEILLTQCMRLEEYYIRNYMQNTKYVSHIRNIEPQFYPTDPWTQALKGKRVLIIHPFADTIKNQYQHYSLLFPIIIKTYIK